MSKALTIACRRKTLIQEPSPAHYGLFKTQLSLGRIRRKLLYLNWGVNPGPAYTLSNNEPNSVVEFPPKVFVVPGRLVPPSCQKHCLPTAFVEKMG